MTHTYLKESTDMLTISLEYVQRTICTISIRIYTYERNGHTFVRCFWLFCSNSLQDKDQRSMDMETARVMLQLLLGKHWPLFTQFAQFLDQSKYKVINKDQWCNILEFSRTINHDLSNYDLDGACKCTGEMFMLSRIKT